MPPILDHLQLFKSKISILSYLITGQLTSQLINYICKSIKQL